MVVVVAAPFGECVDGGRADGDDDRHGAYALEGIVAFDAVRRRVEMEYAAILAGVAISLRYKTTGKPKWHRSINHQTFQIHKAQMPKYIVPKAPLLVLDVC